MLANVEHGHLVYREEKLAPVEVLGDFAHQRLITEQLIVHWETSPNPHTGTRPGAQASDAANLITSSTWRLASTHLIEHKHTLSLSRTCCAPSGREATHTARHGSVKQGPNQHLLPGWGSHSCSVLSQRDFYVIFSLMKWPSLIYVFFSLRLVLTPHLVVYLGSSFWDLFLTVSCLFSFTCCYIPY